MIELRNVSKTYNNGTEAVKNITLHIKPGEFVSLVGRSGTGKTTLVKMLVAEERPTEGRIILGGWDITRIKTADIPMLRRQIGVVFQDYKLLPRKTVFENVAFALEVASYSKKHIQEAVPQILALVGLEPKANEFPDELSGGQQQRVSIARALAHRPKILIADEPTGNLDSVNTREIIDLLLKINNFKTTVMLVTHNRDVVNSLRKRVVALEDGKIAYDQERGRYIL
ncbi:cell division ATP-binding protein FtsE [Candidatus Kuenenbacteria bacterium RIFCSPLOWO2_12_FULL_42_13]|uniref:Cell division ATP-binding protein FtsE n=4 Tax=Candidatus Kueneniibacteriota TaxID=1752740 RepID=A0A0G1BS57_9BACT|nr:MAG: Cell division ATP-binding protein FtsE [Candidatus Kuenenbacteria bacterium GW2011_GWA2_42_15]OGG91986.1 MAG: cell division ATP-binding protein FtsE [Candidatus Kuenenbacteria bacterium RIFCSPLOWO2_12_FULL_42_13]OGG95979.1 MAG: cell division ATP-binding protein FtsE [Candidatus Kuenenbacteria bacterium RBG_16_41_7]OGG98474.1 MAG: cell division ATP-binding protein FtsE [Candidatus Kuenenbacteria bacterium RIFCSPHIGHO2_12_FULL_42_14]